VVVARNAQHVRLALERYYVVGIKLVIEVRGERHGLRWRALSDAFTP
jgi:hypothetical protein